MSNHNYPMTEFDMRDYFAARAMQAFIDEANTPEPVVEDGETYQAACARWSYIYADAMLKERSK